MNNKIIKITKFILKNASGIGITLLCSAAAGSIVGKTNPNVFKKVLMGLGGAIIGGILVKQSDDYLEEEIDRGFEIGEQIFSTAGKVSNASNGEK